MSEHYNKVSDFLNDRNFVSIQNDQTINFNSKLKDLLDRVETIVFF